MFGKAGNTLRTFLTVNGLPIYNLSTGKRVGHVCDINISNGKIKGLIVKRGAFFKQSCFLDIKDVSFFGQDGIMIENEEGLLKQATPPENTFAHHNSISGKMIMTKKGNSVGLLKDVYFLEELGTIVGYEYTDGFFSELSEGKRVINSVEPPAIGKDAIIVDANPM